VGRREGRQQVLGVNLYAYQHTDIAKIKRGLSAWQRARIVGRWNDAILRHTGTAAPHSLLAWG